jgi:hypothetical protein
MAEHNPDTQPQRPSDPPPSQKVQKTDIDSLTMITLVISMVVLFISVPLLSVPWIGNFSLWLGFVPLGLGVYTLQQAHKAARPARVRLYGRIVLGIGAAMLLLLLLLTGLRLSGIVSETRNM